MDGGGDFGEVEHDLPQQLDHGVPHLQYTQGEGAHTKGASTPVYHTQLQAFNYLKYQFFMHSSQLSNVQITPLHPPKALDERKTLS